MTHEGASSIRGAYLALLGASAGTIGFVSGLGELIGYSMRYVFGRLTDRTKQYWPMMNSFGSGQNSPGFVMQDSPQRSCTWTI